MVCRAALLFLLQQQQDELDDGASSMCSPYDNEGRWRYDQWLPCPALTSLPLH